MVIILVVIDWTKVIWVTLEFDSLAEAMNLAFYEVLILEAAGFLTTMLVAVLAIIMVFK